jgi:hypothetical protein
MSILDELTHLDTWAKLGETAALLVFGSYVIDTWRRKKREEILEWQKVILYEIIEREGPITLRDLKKLYLNDATQEGLRWLGHANLQDKRLRSVLMQLVEARAIQTQASPHGALYSVMEFPRHSPAENLLLMQELMRQLSEEESLLLSYLLEKDGQLSEADFVSYVKSVGKIAPEQIGAVLNRLYTKHLVLIDQNRKLWRNKLSVPQTITVRPGTPSVPPQAPSVGPESIAPRGDPQASSELFRRGPPAGGGQKPQGPGSEPGDKPTEPPSN